MGRTTRHKADSTPRRDKAIRDLVKRLNKEVARRGLDRVYNSSFFDMIDPSVMVSCMIDMQLEANDMKETAGEASNIHSGRVHRPDEGAAQGNGRGS